MNLCNGNFEKARQGFSVKTGQNFRVLPWMRSKDQKKGHHFFRSILSSVSLHT